uniref:Eukaryotic translation initiation factor 5B n=1 Tax=Accipiter nisus TaxID=211598 RepID=A0A8B9M9M7_9AVES
MGKKQKNKSEDSAKDDIDIDALAAEIEGAGAAKEQEPQKSKGKKKKEKKKQDFDEDDILKELEELSIEAQGGKVDREPSTGKVENDNEESLSKQDKKRKGKSKKANLENDYDSEEVEDKDKKFKKTQKARQDMLSGSDDDDHETQLKKSKGKTQKSNKKHDLSEEDETNVKKSKDRAGAVSTGESGDESDEVSQSRKGQKKNQKPKSTPAAESGDDEEEPSFKVKTVAQKKAEKKERERKKREEEKAKLRKQKEKEELESGKEPAKPKEAQKKAEGKASPDVMAAPGPGEKGETPAGAEADDNEGDKKKKDKKKKKGEKEEKEKEKKKGPSKATVKAMQEALAKMKEEEERAKREEEERIRRLEELEAKRKEEERLEQERKERKKQKEKERKERLKKEGKLLTKAQREARARAEATLKLLQAQGVEVPSKDSVPKKRPIYEDKKKKKQQQPENKEVSESVEVTSPAEDAVELETPVKEETPLPVEPVSEEKEEEEETEDAGLDDWEAMVSDEDGEKESKPVHIEVKEQNEVDEEDEEEEDEEEDEEESEESEDSEGSEDEDEKTSDEREADSQAVGKQSMEKKPSKEISSDSEYDSDDDRTKEERAYDKAKRRIEKRRAENSKNMNTEKLRAPVICVLGHVDTGKTKILDKLRHTHVQDSEAGGITQQIGATNVPLEAINEQTKMVKNFDRENIKIPGMLIIDTPGHESFSNLRNRGSSLCDIAILVVDIMHGLEPQTIESINLLKSKKCPFIVALNKIDRLYDWKKSPDTDVAVTLKKQKKNTKDEFEERAKAIIVEFAKQGLNAALFYENKDPRTFVSLVPTSAHTGDGMGSLIALLVELTQTMLTKRLAECQELRAQVMEVKALPGMGTTIDVILINGRLKEGDTIIVPGVEGPIVTQIRGLLLPPPMKELRVKNQYEKHKEVVAAQGVKILGKDLEKTLAGLPLLVAYKEDEVPVLKYSGINIGPVHKKDVMKASVMLEHDPQYAVILAFDVRIERDAQEMADSLGVRIFSAEIIYHLFDAFTKYRQDYKKQKQEEFKHIAVFPCKMKILPQFIFNSRDPIVMGVVVEAGQVKQGTPMCVPSKNFVEIGIVTSIEINHKPVEVAKKGQEVCVKIEPIPGESPKMYGRHFEATDILVSKISRQSIDALKDWFRDEMQKSDWQLIVELKKVFEII